jgi:pyruvate dehydrogenase E2 component (dihydrolipoamide acetyltransferase)
MAETINMPKLGFDMAEGTLVRWVKKTGESINKGDVLAEIETDKATVEVESSASGVVRKLLVDEGASVPVNTPIAIVGTADEVISDQSSVVSGQLSVVKKEPTAKPDMKPAPVSVATSAVDSGSVKASPLAKKLARDRSLDLSRVHGSGPRGRIVRRDIEQALMTTDHGSQTTVGMPLSVVSQPSSSVDETIGLTKLRQAIARRMAESKTTVPHFYVTHEYKMESLLEVRRQLNNALPEKEKVSVNDFIVKAAALTLKQFPNLNATFQGDKLLRHGQVNVGVAVAVEGGLLTIVCKDANAKPLRQITIEVKTMAGRAREGKVKPEDIEGSTFSISNLGMFDVDEFVAIINPPESAILAVGSAKEVPVVENGQVKGGWRMKATVSVDHRVSDGAEAARFLQALAVYLEEPVRLLV